MPAAFVPRLVNPPFGDPGLYVGLRHQGRAMLFDLGRLDRLPAAALIKLTHVFVSHTHMDHFIGFDHLLRVLLAREVHIALFGPPGIIANVRGKLAGYTWNLIDSYPFELTVHEVHPDRIEAVHLPARTAFTPEPLPAQPFDGTLVDTDTLRVSTAHLDHRIPCLGFALTEKTRLNVRAEALDELGVPPGRWLNRLKDAVRAGEPDDTPLIAEWREQGAARTAQFTVGALRDRLLVATRGQKLAYVVDTLFSQANLERIGALARDADVFFCESLFLDADRDQASKRYHLTARQAATLARAAGVARLETFHFSSRYDRDPAPLRAEAQAVFRGELPPDVPG
ncbi:MAG: ribonuclease Z [Deltaproteobacteria bacterium]|nr:ribonuclease Z [Deltaproteobacteria bacterium]